MKIVLYTLFTVLAMSVPAQELDIMTYNIKLDYPKKGENSWENRKPMLIGQLRFYEPDVFGVQEALPNQVKDLSSELVNYDVVGQGRDGKDQGEYSAVFYKKEQFNVINSSTFWLSETPEKVSKGWDAALNRICTYMLLESVESKKRFWVFNTHFDHVGVVARQQSSKLIVEKIKKLNKGNHPVILMGDFNLEPDSESIQWIKTFLKDSKEISKMTPFGPLGTFNGFHFNEPVNRRIDYIFVSDSNIKVEKIGVLSDSKDCKYPSDHFPVFLKLAFY
jgi:endonuclease/exonuclease/phosphatase family metal-dependent hydrolase